MFRVTLARGRPTLCLPNQGKAQPVYHAAGGLRKDPALTFTAQPSRFARQRVPASGAFLRRLKFWAPSTAAIENESKVAMSAPVSVKEVEEARDAWIAAVKKGSVEETVGCYDPVEGKLLGTVDTPVENVRTGKDLIHQYFVGFLETNYDTVVPNFPATIAEGDLQQLGPGVVAYSGYYTFDLSLKGSGKVANAKFTYIYKRDPASGKLKILLHNSGFTPAGAVAK